MSYTTKDVNSVSAVAGLGTIGLLPGRDQPPAVGRADTCMGGESERPRQVGD